MLGLGLKQLGVIIKSYRLKGFGEERNSLWRRSVVQD